MIRRQTGTFQLSPAPPRCLWLGEGGRSRGERLGPGVFSMSLQDTLSEPLLMLGWSGSCGSRQYGQLVGHQVTSQHTRDGRRSSPAPLLVPWDPWYSMSFFPSLRLSLSWLLQHHTCLMLSFSHCLSGPSSLSRVLRAYTLDPSFLSCLHSLPLASSTLVDISTISSPSCTLELQTHNCFPSPST